MPNNAASTSPLPVSSDDFICNKANVLWLLGHRKFYDQFQPFAQLLQPVEQLARFMKEKGLTSQELAAGCTHCDAFKAMRGQAQILDGFAKIFIWLNDHDRIEELARLLEFVSRLKRKNFKRVILAYSGPATGKKERLVIVE